MSFLGGFFDRNPVGALIGFFLFFIMLVWISTPATSPFGSNSSIVNNMSSLNDSISWLAWLVIPFFPLALILGFSAEQKRELVIKIQSIGQKRQLKGKPGLMDEMEEEDTGEDSEE